MMGSAIPRAMFALLLGCALPAPLHTQVQTQSQSRPAVQAGAETHQLFVFLYRPGPAWVAGQPMARQDLRDHGLYYRRLLDEGRVFAGGGFVGLDGGMAINRAAGAAEAEAILAADPAIRHRVFVADLRRWSPRFVDDEPLAAPRR